MYTQAMDLMAKEGQSGKPALRSPSSISCARRASTLPKPPRLASSKR